MSMISPNTSSSTSSRPVLSVRAGNFNLMRVLSGSVSSLSRKRTKLFVIALRVVLSPIATASKVARWNASIAIESMAGLADVTEASPSVSPYRRMWSNRTSGESAGSHGVACMNAKAAPTVSASVWYRWAVRMSIIPAIAALSAGPRAYIETLSMRARAFWLLSASAY